MDLSEMRGGRTRHPWETARARALERILRTAEVRPRSVLDYGCGDGFTGEYLQRALGARRLLGFDIQLTEVQCRALSGAEVTYANDWASAGPASYDLCLLCDVIEHVADDEALLRIVRERMTDDGRVLITVPAFQLLFTHHDRALKHFRRYTLAQLERVSILAEFELEASGYLFGSLLPGRGASKVLQALKPRTDDDFGIGAWSGSTLVTRALETALDWDNAVLLSLASRGIKLPGLSAWALCKQRRS